MKNLLFALKKAGISQRQASEDLKIDHSLLNRYVLEKTDPSSSMALKIADYLDVSVDYLLGREERNDRSFADLIKGIGSIEEKFEDVQYSIREIKGSLLSIDDCLPVPLLEDPIAAGTPVPISGRSAESRYFTKSWLRRFHKPILVTVGVGQRSMMPTIHPGDLLLIDQQMITDPLPEHIYAVNSEGGGTVKRCALVNDKLKLIPDNPDYSDQVIDVAEADISKIIVGRIVWIARELA